MSATLKAPKAPKAPGPPFTAWAPPELAAAAAAGLSTLSAAAERVPPDSPDLFICTDGSAPGNGSATVRGGFAAVFFGRLAPGGMLAAGCVGCKLWSRGAAGWPTATSDGPPPSNNRAELCALLYAALGARALLEMKRAPKTTRVVIYSDSLISVRTLNEWLPARRAKGTVRELKNLDLVECVDEALVDIRRRADVSVVHVPGHGRGAPPPGDFGVSIAGNALADRIAGLAVTLPDDQSPVVSFSPPFCGSEAAGATVALPSAAAPAACAKPVAAAKQVAVSAAEAALEEAAAEARDALAAKAAAEARDALAAKAAAEARDALAAAAKTRDALVAKTVAKARDVLAALQDPRVEAAIAEIEKAYNSL